VITKATVPAVSQSRLDPIRLRSSDAGRLLEILESDAADVQKSLREGFGLTVVEAMWKGRPIVASGVGGIREQIQDGVSGLLLDDPRDLAAAGDAVSRLPRDPDLRQRHGVEARRAVVRDFLPNRPAKQWLEVLEAVVTAA
jgi:trehalose synthase